ncbi:MAG: response regulator transcription factor [Pseudobdellovibrio sp.]
MKNKVLILDDDQHLVESLKKDFLELGLDVLCLDRVSDIHADTKVQFAVIDLRLSQGQFGLDAITKLIEYNPNVKIIVFSGYGSITTAVEAVKKGAIDYLTKPASFKQIWSALNGIKFEQNDDFKRLSLSEVEHEYIDFLLTKNNGNISKTAKDLGLHRQSLQRKLKKYT